MGGCRLVDGRPMTKINGPARQSQSSGLRKVTNEFGDTQFVVRAPLASAGRRVASESGNITLRLAKDALKNASLIAVSECGTVCVVAGAPPLVDGNVTCWPGSRLLRRTYRGFATNDEADPGKHTPFRGILRSDRFWRWRPPSSSGATDVDDPRPFACDYAVPFSPVALSAIAGFQTRQEAFPRRNAGQN